MVTLLPFAVTPGATPYRRSENLWSFSGQRRRPAALASIASVRYKALFMFCCPISTSETEAVLLTGGAGLLLTGRCMTSPTLQLTSPTHQLTSTTHQLTLVIGWDRPGSAGTSRHAWAEPTPGHWSGSDGLPGRAREVSCRLSPNTWMATPHNLPAKRPTKLDYTIWMLISIIVHTPPYQLLDFYSNNRKSYFFIPIYHY